MNLPTKPSEAIKLMIEKMKVIELDSDYKIDMSFWHFPSVMEEATLVCAGGVLMATMFDNALDIGSTYNPSEVTDDDHDVNVIFSMNHFRYGDVLEGLYVFAGAGNGGVEIHDHCTAYREDVEREALAHDIDLDRDIEPYEAIEYMGVGSPEGFYRDMNKLADDLEKIGY